VQVGQQGQYTYVVKADKSVEYRPVVVERTAGLETVIKSGLKPAETIVNRSGCTLFRNSASACSLVMVARLAVAAQEMLKITPRHAASP
jgi:hypothetical protein